MSVATISSSPMLDFSTSAGFQRCVKKKTVSECHSLNHPPAAPSNDSVFRDASVNVCHTGSRSAPRLPTSSLKELVGRAARRVRRTRDHRPTGHNSRFVIRFVSHAHFIGREDYCVLP
eukprot:COSAG02_NODE_275_length_26232_cov_85.210424_10_plen_118_part_00